MDPLSFADVLQHWIGKRTPERVCYRFGVSVRTLRDWIAGRSVPPETKVSAIADVLRLAMSAQLGLGELVDLPSARKQVSLLLARSRAQREAALRAEASAAALTASSPASLAYTQEEP